MKNSSNKSVGTKVKKSVISKKKKVSVNKKKLTPCRKLKLLFKLKKSKVSFKKRIRYLNKLFPGSARKIKREVSKKILDNNIYGGELDIYLKNVIDSHITSFILKYILLCKTKISKNKIKNKNKNKIIK